MRRTLIVLLAMALGSVALAACGATASLSTTSIPTLGTVSGTFTLDAGLSFPRPIDGTVSFRTHEKTGSVMVTVGDTGKFTAHLHPGEWFVSGRSPMFSINDHEPQCGPAELISVVVDKTTRVKLLCVGK